MWTRQVGHFSTPNSASQLAGRFALLAGLTFTCITSLLAFVFFTTATNLDSTNRPVVVETSTQLEAMDVLVPIRPIESGTPLEPALFKIETRPTVGLTKEVVRDFEEIHGTYARTLIVAGTPLLKDYVTHVKPVNQITARIPPGFRAVTINVDIKTSIEGWAKPGARVDVAWTTSVRNKRAVQIIVENALVVSAGRQTESNSVPDSLPAGESVADGVPNQITLMVPIEDAKKITLASGTGPLSLSLRGDADNGKAEAGIAITEDDLLGVRTPAEKRRAESVVKIRDEQGNLAEFELRHGQLVPIDGDA